MCQRLFFNKVAGLRPVAFLKKRLWQSCFPVNFAIILRTPFLRNSSGQLFLNVSICLNEIVTQSIRIKEDIDITLFNSCLTHWLDWYLYNGDLGHERLNVTNIQVLKMNPRKYLRRKALQQYSIAKSCWLVLQSSPS